MRPGAYKGLKRKQVAKLELALNFCILAKKQSLKIIA